MGNNEYAFFMVFGFLIVSILYLLIRELHHKDKDMYYDCTESNMDLIESLRKQEKELNELLQHNKSKRTESKESDKQS